MRLNVKVRQGTCSSWKLSPPKPQKDEQSQQHRGGQELAQRQRREWDGFCQQQPTLGSFWSNQETSPSVVNSLGFYHKRGYLGTGDCPWPGPGDVQPSLQLQVRANTHGFTSYTHASWLAGPLCGPTCKAAFNHTGHLGIACWRLALTGTWNTCVSSVPKPGPLGPILSSCALFSRCFLAAASEHWEMVR